eukprot:GHVU01126003.1.p1 GENE.GHVU01126003.1~~GHVU01126003.1.p1  ORF type:complete len:170 (-),score=26.25 GHVU01126003.1:21-530(-)
MHPVAIYAPWAKALDRGFERPLAGMLLMTARPPNLPSWLRLPVPPCGANGSYGYHCRCCQYYCRCVPVPLPLLPVLLPLPSLLLPLGWMCEDSAAAAPMGHDAHSAAHFAEMPIWSHNRAPRTPPGSRRASPPPHLLLLLLAAAAAVIIILPLPSLPQLLLLAEPDCEW